ncbi:c6 zinc finger domain-containing protein [Diplodia corticola]|uniref:C6 zinc finger domain-containing protein n=1 Tax=Diplodia corticola TaxID=236234 RepID=A0A1J9S381_9PEZI|nr:c6 zinc finger domain-containing protein [Diplodia corticola]OJD34085.1 c6 zinc finger domain-containing protein [Diplodia corticola]
MADSSKTRHFRLRPMTQLGLTTTYPASGDNKLPYGRPTSSPAFMEPQPRRRRRPALSCLACRRRKIKCDRKDPCTHCVSARYTCTYKVYRDSPVTPHPPESTSTQDRPITEPHSQLSGSRVVAAAAGQDDTLTDIGNDARNDTPPRAPTSEAEPVQQPTASSPIKALTETGRDILERQSGLQDSQITLNKTRTLRWSNWLGTAPEFATIDACFAEATGTGKGPSFQGGETGALVAQMGHLLLKCKEIARKLKVGRPSRRLSRPGFSLAFPSREVSDKMASLYFQSYESTHRILHVSTFWAEYERYWRDPESAPIDLRLKILLVIGIGSSLHEHGDADAGFRNMVHQWVYAAQSWLSGPLEKDRLEVSGLQIHCLSILARQIFSIGGDLVWVSMGSVIHRAMQIGLHRDPKHLPAMSVLQAELRRRLWATILEMVVQSSLDSAMPPRISFDDFDTQAPSNNDDDEMNDSTTTLQPHPKGTYTTTSIQLLLLDSLPTRLRVLHLLNGLRSELSYLDVLALSSEITDAYCACSSFMRANERSGITPFHRNLLDYLIRRFMVPLHCPFASKARTNPLFHYSLKASLDTAMAIVSPEPDEGFSHLMAIGGGMFREGFRYACTVISLELIAQAEAQRLDGTLHRNSQYLDLLRKAVKDLMWLSLDRIRQGETNIKSHMFLSMVVAQVEAIEGGTACELKVAQSAKDSLEFCRDLLQTRADFLALSDNNDPGPLSASPGSGQGGFGFGFDLDFEFSFPDAGFS